MDDEKYGDNDETFEKKNASAIEQEQSDMETNCSYLRDNL